MQQFNVLSHKNTLILNAKEIEIYGKAVKKVPVCYITNIISFE